MELNKRIPEPELMDSEAQTLAYAEADFSDANSLFVSTFLERFPGLADSGNLADLGCGPADICIRVSNKLPGWQLTGFDAGENMLKQAASAVKTSDVADRVSLKLSYLPDETIAADSFNAIISNSLLHHLPDPSTLWDTIARIGRPGAAVTVMDLRRPETTDLATQLVESYAGDEPQVLKDDFYYSLLAAYTPEEIKQQLQDAGLESLNIELVSDRHFLVHGTLDH